MCSNSEMTATAARRQLPQQERHAKNHAQTCTGKKSPIQHSAVRAEAITVCRPHFLPAVNAGSVSQHYFVS